MHPFKSLDGFDSQCTFLRWNQPTKLICYINIPSTTRVYANLRFRQ